MNANTLVLNRGFLAIHIMDHKKAISLVYQGHAEAVDSSYVCYSFENWVALSESMTESDLGFIHTPTLKISIPAVIRLTRYDRLPSADVKFTVPNLFSHYNNICSYCGHKFPSSDLNRDHIVPRSRGGKTNWDNIVPSCIPCNKKKADKTPEEAGMRLLVKPEKPRWKGPSQMIRKMPRIKVHDSWHNFLDMS
jgi:5-methylcytosine-specific restriction endonuclease McrA